MTRKLIGMLIVATAMFGACKKEKPKEDVVLNAVPTTVNDMPALFMTLSDTTRVFFKAVTGKVVMMFFNPDCDHCQRQAELLAANKQIFEGYKVYFISNDTLPAVTKFSKDYNLVEPNFYFGHADGMEVYRSVGPINTVPTFLIYNNQALVARMEGEISIEKLKKMLE